MKNKSVMVMSDRMELNGFAPILILFVVLILGGVGFIGFQYYKMYAGAPIAKIPSALLYPSPSPDPTANWKTFDNTDHGYSFEYPPSYTENHASSDYISLLMPKDTNNLQGEQLSIININTYKYSYEFANMFPEKMQTFKEYAINVAKRLCDADGPSGSSFCDEVISEKPIVSSNGISGFEIHLKHTIQSDGQETRYLDRGPIYVFDISEKDPTVKYVALLFEASYGNTSTKEKETLKQIVDTLKFIN